MKTLLWHFNILLLAISSYGQLTCTNQTVCTGPGVNLSGATITIENNSVPISVEIQPTASSVQVLLTQQFTAMVTGSSNTTVTWSVVEGALYGTVSASGLYTAPALVPVPDTAHVRATSVADPSKTADATITILASNPPPPCSVSISPQNISVGIGLTQQFTATVDNCTPSTVTWDVNGTVGGNGTIGTISPAGFYTAPAVVPNPAQVSVRAVSDADGTKSATALVTIFNNTPPPTTENMNCLPGDISTVAGFMDGPALLPQDCVYTSLSSTPATGTVRTVTDVTSWNVQTGLMSCGDVLVIPNGVTIIGNLTLPNKPCDANHWIWLMASNTTILTAEGTRITPCFWGVTSLPGRPTYPCPGAAHNGASILTNNTTPPLALATGANHYRIMGIELGRTSTTGLVSELLKTSTASTFNHIIMDRVWCHGDATHDTNNCFNMGNGDHIAVIASYINDTHCVANTGACTQSHAVSGGGVETRQDGAFKVWNNFLESAGENIFFGGGPANFTPQSIDLRNNYLFKPRTWNPADPTYFGTQFSVQNFFETKNSDEVFFEGNVCENSWAGFSQVGEAFLLDPKNQSNGPGQNQCPICQVTNIVITLNKAHSVSQFMQIADIANGNGAYATAGHSYHIYQNVIDNVLYAECYKCSTGTSTHTIFTDPGIPVSLRMSDVWLENNTVVLSSNTPTSSLNAVIGTSGPMLNTNLGLENIKFRNNLVAAGKQGTSNNIGGGLTTNCAFGQTGGTPMITNCWSPFEVLGNAFIGNVNATWPGQPAGSSKWTDWFLLPYPQRTTQHSAGSLSPHNFWLDQDGVKVWFPKDPSGHPWDIYVIGTPACGAGLVCLLATDDGSDNQFSNPNAYKRPLTPRPLWPQYFQSGQIYTQTNAGPVGASNPGIATSNCEKDNPPTFFLGDTQGVLDGTPKVVPSIGTFPVIEADYYWSGSHGVYNFLEKFYGAGANGGWVQWESYKLVGGVYVLQTTNSFQGIVAGGSPTPAWSCGTNFSWWQGGPVPVAGGNAASSKAGQNCTAEISFANALVNWNNGLNGDYHLKPTSACANVGTDGNNPGANIDQVNTATNGVDTF